MQEGPRRHVRPLRGHLSKAKESRALRDGAWSQPGCLGGLSAPAQLCISPSLSLVVVASLLHYVSFVNSVAVVGFKNAVF